MAKDHEMEALRILYDAITSEAFLLCSETEQSRVFGYISARFYSNLANKQEKPAWDERSEKPTPIKIPFQTKGGQVMEYPVTHTEQVLGPGSGYPLAPAPEFGPNGLPVPKKKRIIFDGFNESPIGRHKDSPIV